MNDRKSDERLLEILDLRYQGVGSTEIGKRFGMTNNAVRAATNKVRREDEAHEPGAARYYG